MQTFDRKMVHVQTITYYENIFKISNQRTKWVHITALHSVIFSITANQKTANTYNKRAVSFNHCLSYFFQILLCYITSWSETEK